MWNYRFLFILQLGECFKICHLSPLSVQVLHNHISLPGYSLSAILWMSCPDVLLWLFSIEQIVFGSVLMLD
jgi:hypothetical protein